jgi:hypothetical protein
MNPEVHGNFFKTRLVIPFLDPKPLRGCDGIFFGFFLMIRNLLEDVMCFFLFLFFSYAALYCYLSHDKFVHLALTRHVGRFLHMANVETWMGEE